MIPYRLKNLADANLETFEKHQQNLIFQEHY